jgi:glycosyltransferase involved in cell wall biosynthesis
VTTLSVVIPVHNSATRLPILFESLRRNYHQDFEFILVDDASTDNTPELIAEYRERLPGLVSLRNEEPVGLAAARNQGLARSSGDFLSFVDGKDWLLGGYLEQLVSAISGLDVDFVRVDHIRATGKQRQLVRAPTGKRNVTRVPAELIAPASRQTLVDYHPPWAGIYHRRLVERGLLNFPSELSPAEDRPWIWRLHLEAEACAVTSLAGYFRNPHSEMSWAKKPDGRELHYLTVFKHIMNLVANRSTPIKEKALSGFLTAINTRLESENEFPRATRRLHRQEVRAQLGAINPILLTGVLSSLGAERKHRISRCLNQRTWSFP